MMLLQLFLPLYDNEGTKLPQTLFGEVKEELAKRFGGITAYNRAPVEGLWKDDSAKTTQDELVIFEVMAEDFDPGWWKRYRELLDQRFRQDRVLVRAQEIEVL
jgi:hypothetical protein